VPFLSVGRARGGKTRAMEKLRSWGWRPAVAAMVAALASAAPAGAVVSLLQIGTFAQPVYVTAPPSDVSRVFVVQKTGKIAVVRGGVSTTFLDITGRVRSSGNEQGLLSMAFAPDYATSGTFYVYYTAQPPGGSGAPGSDLTISAFHATDADHADPTSERMVLTIPHRKFDNHNGGNLQIGPDGMLWLGTGDGGDANDSLGNAPQTSPSWNDAAAGHDARLGKLLRIDPEPDPTQPPGCDGRCTIPAGNPGFAQPEIWAKGLRNPWRFSFDRGTGDLVIGDVGQDTWEEVDFAAAPARGVGADYGWDAYEGLHPRGSTAPAGSPAGITMPVLEKAHAAPDSFSSIAGGYVVRDPALPDLLGRYVYADTYQGEIRAVTVGPGGATADTDTGLHASTLASFGEDACGRVYAVSLDGPVYRLAQGGECVAPPSAGGPGVTSPDKPGTPDGGAGTGGPTVTLKAAARQRPWTTGVVRVRISCNEICDITARGTFLITKANKNASTAVVKLLRTATTKTTLAAGATVSVTAKVSARTRRSLLRALHRGRRITLRFAVTATDRAGHTKTTSARSRIVRR
jgi:glucose/arabinose dehydrogenase